MNAIKRRAWQGLFASVALALTVQTARAEVHEIKIAQQFGLHYLPMVIMQHFNLVEKHARALGLGDLKVEWARLSGGASVNDALLSDSVQFAAGGVGPLIKIWDKTIGNMEVKGVAAVSNMPMTLVTNNPNFKSLKDITDQDRIALPAVKVSMQAVTLQMAAAKLFGDDGYARLDKYTVSMKHPDAAVMLLSGSSGIDAHFSAPPYTYIELADPKVHKVTDSFEIYGGPATLIVLYTHGRFHRENPRTYQAVLGALGEAMDIINRDKREATETYLKATGEKMTPDAINRFLADPKINYTLTPTSILPIAQFMHRIGTVKTRAGSWKDLFFPEIHDRPGS